MVKKANEELQAQGTPVGSVAVVALGYNSLWEKNRRNYDKWAKKFDDEADALLATLTEPRRQEDRVGDAARADRRTRCRPRP